MCVGGHRDPLSLELEVLLWHLALQQSQLSAMAATRETRGREGFPRAPSRGLSKDPSASSAFGRFVSGGPSELIPLFLAWISYSLREGRGFSTF